MKNRKHFTTHFDVISFPRRGLKIVATICIVIEHVGTRVNIIDGESISTYFALYGVKYDFRLELDDLNFQKPCC